MNTILIDKLTDGLNNQQKQAVEMPLNSFTKVVAGAGTGKTKIISKRYIKLVNDLLEDKSVEKPLEHLLVITFTQKAAAEMKERILKELKENNINHYGQENKISTIHSFCSDILRRHSIEANLSPDFKLAEDTQLEKIYETIIRKIHCGEYATIDFIDEVLSDLNLSSDILEHKNILKLKSAGSLESVFSSVLPVIKQVKSLGLTPQEFLDKTLSANSHYSSFIAKFLKEKYSCSHFSNIYSDENMMVEDWCNFFKNNTFADENYKNYSDKDVFENLLKISVNKNNAKKSPKTDFWTPKYDCIKDFGSSMINEITEVENLLTKVIAIIYAVYQRHLEELDLVDFDDLINKTLCIFKNNEVIRSYYKKYFKHIIVDEFQDTSGAQLELLMTLISDEAPNLTVVGDRKQSIYAFRYARMENLDLIQEKIEKKFAKNANIDLSEKIKVIKLETNYRSTAQVLEAVNAVTEHSLALDEALSAFSEETIPHSVKFTKPEKCQNASKYRDVEVKYFAKEINDVMQRDGLKYKDFAVLVSAHDEADFIEEQLAKYGIPSVKKVNTSYFEKNAVKNIMFLFKFVQNIKNEIALVKLLEIKYSDREIYNFKTSLDKTVGNIGDDDISMLNMSEKILKTFEKNCFDEIDCSEEIKNTVEMLLDTVLSISKNKNTLSLTAIFYKLTDVYRSYNNLSGVEKILEDIDITVFEKILADYVQNSGYTSIKNFIEYIATISADKNFEMPAVFSGEFDAVNLLTIHASKGLEFPYTFVAGLSSLGRKSHDYGVYVELNEGVGNFGLIIEKFNGKSSLKSLIYKQIYKAPREYAEAKRRFYVAVSRAKKYLNVMICNQPAKYIKDLTEHNAKKGENYAPLEHLVYPIENDNISVNKRPMKVPSSNTDTGLKVIAPKFNDTQKEKLSLSFSKINTFNHCQRKFLYNSVYRYPEIGEKSQCASVGTILHGLICYSFVNEKVLNFDEIEIFLQDVKADKVVMDKVISLYSSFAKSRYSTLLKKETFSEYGFEFEYKNAVFKGDIDLIVKNSDDTIDIIDFKTNENLEKSLADYNKQMFVYKSAVEEQRFSVRKLVFANIKTDTVTDFEVLAVDIENAKKEINSDIKNIKNLLQTKQPTVSGQNECQYCGYRYLCVKN